MPQKHSSFLEPVDMPPLNYILVLPYLGGVIGPVFGLGLATRGHLGMSPVWRGIFKYICHGGIALHSELWQVWHQQKSGTLLVYLYFWGEQGGNIWFGSCSMGIDHAFWAWGCALLRTSASKKTGGVDHIIYVICAKEDVVWWVCSYVMLRGVLVLAR